MPVVASRKDGAGACSVGGAGSRGRLAFFPQKGALLQNPALAEKSKLSTSIEPTPRDNPPHEPTGGA
ncbi:hypothetical protein DOI34_26655 [Salmonella enterica subsp. enterica serovar Virchow]|nr:hypothetical protein [Salmonella enterica subsp. enterica serovar Virchow]ECI7686022.1 hypothetical protein [Salmonella enterica subsp. enterica serovar Paratyphi A]MIL09413.1 hypothetical protein [Salmonella enterica subsp. enterica serovar Enteritidis]